jgi:hypothetical protein
VSYQVLSAKAWASREFGAVELKDKRLTKRVVQIAAGMAADPQGSIPKQNKAPHQSKAAYRLFDHERAIMDSLCNPHWQQTRLGCSHCPVVLLIQDTTWLDYSAHPQTQGTGWCNYHRKEQDHRQRPVPAQRAGGRAAGSGDGAGDRAGLGDALRPQWRTFARESTEA